MNTPAPLANLNGELMPLSEARVPVLDRGFLFGDAVYEVLRVYGGKPWLADEHFTRLKRSLAAIRIEGIDLPRLRSRMDQALKAGPFAEATVYFQITRGAAPRTHAFPADVKPTELLWVQAYSDSYKEARQVGTSVIVYPDLRWGRCDIKSTNLLGNVLALQAAKEANCLEALLVKPDGTLTEATHSSLFGVIKGVVVTAPESPGILPGVTRRFLLELAARAKVQVREQALRRDQLSSIDELFMSGTTMEVMPVIRVDGKLIADGQPGVVTRQLLARYRNEVQTFLAK
jgi:D-alanine transaminase